MNDTIMQAIDRLLKVGSITIVIAIMIAVIAAVLVDTILDRKKSKKDKTISILMQLKCPSCGESFYGPYCRKCGHQIENGIAMDRENRCSICDEIIKEDHLHDPCCIYCGNGLEIAKNQFTFEELCLKEKISPEDVLKTLSILKKEGVLESRIQYQLELRKEGD